MPKLRPKLLLLILALSSAICLALAGPLVQAQADRIIDLEIQVDLLANGDAWVTQIWQTDCQTGTEFYIPLQNLNHMGIEEFTVQDESGRKYQFVDDWFVDWSFADKAWKNGFNHTSAGLELCFGKSQYGPKTYTLRYRQTRTIQAFPDQDGFNLRLVNPGMQPAPEQVSVTIQAQDQKLSSENSKIWAFGFPGQIDFVDGKILGQSDHFDQACHLTILAGFDKGIFQPEFQGQGDFAALKAKALADSDYLEEDQPVDQPGHSPGPLHNSDLPIRQAEIGEFPSHNRSFFAFMPNFLAMFTRFLFPIFVILFGFGIASGKKLPRPKNLNQVQLKEPVYSRDIPFDCYLPAFSYFYGLKQRSLPKNSDLISAYILKWVKAGALEYKLLNREQGMLFFKREVESPCFEIKAEPKTRGQFEGELWSYLVAAAGENQILEEDELAYYFKRHQQKIGQSFNQIKTEGLNYAVDQGLIRREKANWGINYYLTDQGISQYQALYAFERYLKDFTLINERQTQEVAIWDDLLIMAAAYGIGEEVLQQLQRISPNYSFSQAAQPGLGPDPSLAIYLASRSMANHAYQSYQAASNSSSIHRSSGFGGGSSIGGGSGFSGGGFGGGSR